MGENKHIKELDALTKKYVQEIEEKSPSLDFTDNLMESILKIQKSDVFKATPLISKKIWLLISGVILSLFFIPFKPTENSITNKIPEIDLSFLNKIQIPNLFESFSISNTVLYVVLFFGLMIIAQIAFLKNHFDKKFQ